MQGVVAVPRFKVAESIDWQDISPLETRQAASTQTSQMRPLFVGHLLGRANGKCYQIELNPEAAVKESLTVLLQGAVMSGNQPNANASSR